MNIAKGAGALASVSTGKDCVVLGHEAGRNNVSGDKLIAIGTRALYSNNTGTESIAIGFQSLFHNTDGLANIGIGVTALFCATNGSLNIGVGHHALYDCTSGGGNVAIGYNSNWEITTGSFNTTVGHDAGRGVSIGSNNTILGAQVGSGPNSPLPANLTNAVILATGDGRIWADFNMTIRGTWYFNAAFKTPVLTVASLPTPTAALTGARLFVSDATSTSFSSIVVGGGTNKAPVYCDGTHWRIG